MNVSIILLCLLLSYIFLYFLSIRYVLVFCSVIFLLHRFMGPKWILNFFYELCGYFYVVLLFMVTHYYFSSVLIIVVCTWSFVHGIVSLCYSQRNLQMDDIREELIELNSKVDNLESKINEALTLLARIEVQLS